MNNLTPMNEADKSEGHRYTTFLKSGISIKMQFFFEQKANLVFHCLLFVANSCYLSYIVLLAYHNRLAADDYCHLAELQKHFNPFYSVYWWYFHWTGCFAQVFLLHCILLIKQFIPFLFFYILLLSFSFIYLFYKILRLVLNFLNTETQIRKAYLLNISAFICCLFYNLTFDLSTLFWLTASSGYFVSLLFLLIGFYAIVADSKLSYLLIFISFLYAGSTPVNYSMIFLLFLGIACQIVWLKRRELKPQLLYKCFFAFTVCFFAFVVMVSSPGIQLRRAYFEQVKLMKAIGISLKNMPFLWILIQEKLKYILILSFPIIYFGTLFRNVQTLQESKVALRILYAFPLFVLLCWFCILPTAYAIAQIGPLRSLSHIAFYLSILIVVLSFMTGYQSLFPQKIAWVLSILVLLFFVSISLKKIADDIPQIARYTKSEDLRIKKLLDLKAKSFKSTAVVEPLYQTSYPILMSNEIRDDNFWVNECICEALSLGFQIQLKRAK